MTKILFPVTEPCLGERERRYLLDAFDSGWISSQGPWLKRFEQNFAAFCGTRYALACANGTVALHGALLALGAGPGREVILPTFTYVATANAVRYTGARPVFVDALPDTWNLDPACVESAIGERTIGIISVHLYGHPCDMGAILDLARRHGLFVLEDAAEAHGATYRGKRVGSLGEAGIFSLYGNKIITTGEGGVMVTNDGLLARKMARIRGQGMDPNRRYWFPEVGYNYRLTNLQAALGCAQLEQIEFLLGRHREVAGWYRREFASCEAMILPAERTGCRSAWWLYSVRLKAAEKAPKLRDQLMVRLRKEGIDTRPFFYPMHVMPVYREQGEFPVAERVAASGLNLPSSPKLRREDVRFIARRVKKHAEELSRVRSSARGIRT